MKYRCPFCNKTMKNYISEKGRFKGEIQEHCFICNCKEFNKDLVLSIG